MNALLRSAIGGMDLAKGPFSPDGVSPPREAHSNASLARIADALGLPVSHFYTAAGGKVQAGEAIKPRDGELLALVRSYLQTVDATARREFAEAVKVFADSLPS